LSFESEVAICATQRVNVRPQVGVSRIVDTLGAAFPCAAPRLPRALFRRATGFPREDLNCDRDESARVDRAEPVGYLRQLVRLNGRARCRRRDVATFLWRLTGSQPPWQ
jgi:hypothetical protein